jgi:hypothetical protein
MHLRLDVPELFRLVGTILGCTVTVLVDGGYNFVELLYLSRDSGI